MFNFFRNLCGKRPTENGYKKDNLSESKSKRNTSVLENKPLIPPSTDSVSPLISVVVDQVKAESKLKPLVRGSASIPEFSLAIPKVLATAFMASFYSEQFMKLIAKHWEHEAMVSKILGAGFVYAGFTTAKNTRYHHQTRSPLPPLPERAFQEYLKWALQNSDVATHHLKTQEIKHNNLDGILNLVVDYAGESLDQFYTSSHDKTPQQNESKVSNSQSNPSSNIEKGAIKIFCWIYSCFGGLSGRLAMPAIAVLAANIMQSSYNDKCEQPRSPWWQIALVAVGAILICGANVRSFHKYNFKRITEEYIDWFLRGKKSKDHGTAFSLMYWSIGGPDETSLSTKIQSVLGPMMATLGSFYSGKKLLKSFAEAFQPACSQSEPEWVRNFIYIPISIIAALSTYAVMRLMTLPAVHKRNSNQAKRSIDYALWALDISSLTHANRALCIALNAINNGLATIIALTTISGKESVDFDFKDESAPLFILGAILALGVTILNMLAVDFEALNNEYAARIQGRDWRAVANFWNRKNGFNEPVMPNPVPGFVPAHFKTLGFVEPDSVRSSNMGMWKKAKPPAPSSYGAVASSSAPQNSSISSLAQS